MKEKEITIPVSQKIALTIPEAAAYSNIGINKINQMLRQPNCPFVLYVGTKKLVKRKEFEEFISKIRHFNVLCSCSFGIIDNILVYCCWLMFFLTVCA